MDRIMMNNIVREELDYIPKGNTPKNLLRMLYQQNRMSSLSKSNMDRQQVLIESTKEVRWRVFGYRNFIPKYNQQYFRITSEELKEKSNPAVSTPKFHFSMQSDL